MDQPPPSGNPQLRAHIDHNRFVGRTRVAYFSMEIAIAPEMPTIAAGSTSSPGTAAHKGMLDLLLPEISHSVGAVYSCRMCLRRHDVYPILYPFSIMRIRAIGA